MRSWERVFAIIWSGQLASIFTSITVNFAVVLWITFETGSAEMLAYATVAALMPQALIGPFSGVFIDRWDRKRVMMLADSFIALCTLILAILFWMDLAKMWHIFVLLAFRSVGSAFHMPAMQASVPMLAPEEEVGRIAGINQMISSFSNILGPMLAALLIIVWRMEFILMLDVAGALIAVTSLLFVKIPNPDRNKERALDVLREMKEGIRVVLDNRGVAWVFLFSALVMLFLMPVSVLFPLMTTEHFMGNETQVGIVEAIWGAGAFVGGAIMGSIKFRRRVLILNISYLLLGLTFLFSGFLSSDEFVWFVVLTAIAGVTGAMYNASFTAIVQTNMDPSVLGRVFSMYFSMSLFPSIIGLIGIGFFAEYLGVTLSFVICGTVIIVIGIAAFVPPSSIRLDRCSK